MREKALSDWTSGINHARREGREEGRKETARNMMANGEPVDKIIRYTGLTREEIENQKERYSTGCV